MKPERHTEGSPETLTTPDLDRQDAGEVAANFVKTGSKSEKLAKSEKFKASSLACAPETECGRTRLGAGQDPAKRSQILEGAQSVFLRMGFDAASMNDITREAGVSKGTIYVYFNSKEDLFVALCEHYRHTMFSTLIGKLDNGFSNREELTEFGIALVTLITSSTAIRAQRIVLGVSERKPELSARFYDRGPKRSLVAMAEYLEKMIEDGVLEPFDVDRVAYQLSDLFLAGLYRPRLFGVIADEPSDEAIRKNVETAVDFFFRAYGKTS
ncbi:TetR family transcriptional regulator [Ochrobactrum sp. P6BS-III]|uniref:TetR/AcrR family transcriptional regulator n=1 Tax=unclassified Ochrobactrum TaxID=239106 RepID=UPI0009929E1F|nr:AcrR family transcriptional regulator [Ochrobactrum sp. P6BSIII]OOL14861.1 TetR family transcriptional regulator [Ochrobactrum sp. P6BS-III]